jgi:hypothetical protein
MYVCNNVPVSGHCPGETGSLLWLSFSLRSRPETGFVAICIKTKNCDVLPHIMHKVTFTSPHMIHIFVEMYVCICVYVPVCPLHVWAF